MSDDQNSERSSSDDEDETIIKNNRSISRMSVSSHISNLVMSISSQFNINSAVAMSNSISDTNF